MSLVWIDGRLVDKNDARVSVFDHGFLYGDGVWEGLRAYAGTPFRLRILSTRCRSSTRTPGRNSSCT